MKKVFVYLILITALILVFIFQLETPFSHLSPMVRRLLRQPFNSHLSQQLALELEKLPLTSHSSLEDELESRAKYLMKTKDWQELEKTVKELENKHLSFKNKLQLALELDQKYPNYPALKLVLASLYYQKGELATAAAYLNQAKKLDPNNPLIGKLETLIKISAIGTRN